MTDREKLLQAQALVGEVLASMAAAPAPLPPPPTPIPAPPSHARCGWIGAGDTAGAKAFAANASYYHAIHPVAYAIQQDGVSLRTFGAEALALTAAACKASGVQLWPTVAAVRRAGEEGAALGDDVVLRTMMTDPIKRAAHIRTLTALASEKGYAGLDIDYEKLGGQIGDKKLFSDFIGALAVSLHAAGKKLSVCVRGLSRGNSNDYADYIALVGTLVDALHIMLYDFHNDSTHDGPLAPQGWAALVFKFAASTGQPGRFIVGLGNYANHGTESLAVHAARAGAGYATTSTHMATCDRAEEPAVKVDGREPHYGSGATTIYFDDAASLEEKVRLAKAAGIGGVCLWTVGGEPPGFFDMVRRYY